MSFKKIDKVLIIGLGLIGGSIAKALKNRNAVRHISAYDLDLAVMRRALEAGFIDQEVTDPKEAIPKADLVIWALPVGKICTGISDMAEQFQPGQVVTDVGSVKQQVMSVARSLPAGVYFIGGHPMSGKETSGFTASDPELFHQRPWILTPDQDKATDANYQRALWELQRLIAVLEAIPIPMSAAEHDRSAALLSHLPQLVSSCLMNTVGDLLGRLPSKDLLAAGGFRDTTRIAGSNPEMWRDILLANRDELLNILDCYEGWLRRTRECLLGNDDQGIIDILSQAAEKKDL